MITARLSPHDRRVLVRGLGVMVVLLTVTRGLPAWRSWLRDSRGSAETLTTELAQIEAGLPNSRTLADTLRARSTALARLEGTLLPGDSPAAAAASLSEVVSTAAEAANVRLASLQVRSDSTGENRVERGPSAAAGGSADPPLYLRVTVRADATGDVNGITGMLSGLESDSLRVRIRALSITQPEPAAPPTQPEALRMEVVVEGLVGRIPTTRMTAAAPTPPTSAARQVQP